MLNKLRSEKAAHWATGVLVVLVSGTAGQFAAQGMNSIQWTGAVLAIGGSVALAVMVRVWPAPARARSRD